MVDEAVFHADPDLLTVLALGFGALVVVQAALEALRGWTLRVFGHLLSFQIVGNLVRHMLRLPAEFFEKRHVGDIFSRIGAVQPIQDAITRGVVASIIDGVMAFVAAVILFFYSATLAFVVVAAMLLTWCSVFAALSRHARADGGGDPRPAPRSSRILMETVRAATTIKLHGPRGRARERMAQSLRRSDQRRHFGRQVPDRR